ncbi:hypothetical protein RV18_GL003700 [Enterococcus termitis]|nr:hypothetical protein RV18_GL003700 [Enterococcus termitis]
MEMRYEMKKIMICGPVGSGKTTFAKKLAAKEKIQLVELDNLIWERNPRGDKRFTKEQSIQLLQGTLATESWIIEGTTTQDWIKPAVAQADIILLLLPPYHVRLYRIFSRFIKQKRNVEQANYTPTFQLLKQMIVWNHHYEQKNIFELKRLNDSFPDKIIVLKELDAYAAYKIIIRDYNKNY